MSRRILLALAAVAAVAALFLLHRPGPSAAASATGFLLALAATHLPGTARERT